MILKIYDTPNRYKNGWLLCANNCLRVVSQDTIFNQMPESFPGEPKHESTLCAWCSDESDYNIPPPKGFQFDDGPPKNGSSKEKGRVYAPKGFKESWITQEMRDAFSEYYRNSGYA